MKKLSSLLASFALMFPMATLAAPLLSQEAKTATVIIVNYDSDGRFVGWGSGFFVDEGIVVTNKHVIENGSWFVVYPTGSDEMINQQCNVKITKTDVRINLDDDVAYMRAYLPCAHGIMDFANDPAKNDPLYILGYPYKGSVSLNMRVSVSTGSVIGFTTDGWDRTNAHMDIGNSGGPVVNGTHVLGVAVAKKVDTSGKYIEGYFIPSSVIYRGLLYGNDSGFGYTPQAVAPLARSSSSSSSSSVSSSSSLRSSTSSSVRSSSSSSRRPPTLTPLQVRTCVRVDKLAARNPSMRSRINVRLQKHFGFQCRS